MAIAVTSEQRTWAESIRAVGGDPGELCAVALLRWRRVRSSARSSPATAALSIAGGTTQVLLNVAAERLLGLPR